MNHELREPREQKAAERNETGPRHFTQQENGNPFTSHSAFAYFAYFAVSIAGSSPGLNLSLSLRVSLLGRVKAYAPGDGLPPAGERRLGHDSAQAGVDPQGAAGANLPARGFPFSIGPQAAIDCAWTTAGN